MSSCVRLNISAQLSESKDGGIRCVRDFSGALAPRSELQSARPLLLRDNK